MADTRKIFVGSSREALEVAKLVGEVIKETGMVPLVWDTMFPAGDILLEAIEKLPSEVDGAVLLATPDVCCKREEESFDAPVANVVFEYGYLAARLTRKRVAICKFEGATIPSDLEGMTVVLAGNYEKGDPLPLPEDATRNLRSWLERLPPLADGIPPISRVHGYSGRWEVQNRFSRWRGYELGVNDDVYFRGTTFLLLPVDGERGSGTQTGKLYISIDNYKATYEIANRVHRATVTEDGTLNMRVEVLSRTRIKEEGEPREAGFREELAGDGKFDLVLKPVPGKSKRLKGTHTYDPALRVNQEAKEEYTYLGF